MMKQQLRTLVAAALLTITLSGTEAFARPRSNDGRSIYSGL